MSSREREVIERVLADFCSVESMEEFVASVEKKFREESKKRHKHRLGDVSGYRFVIFKVLPKESEVKADSKQLRGIQVNRIKAEGGPYRRKTS